MFVRLLFVIVIVLCFFLVFGFLLQIVYVCCDVSPRSGRTPFSYCVVVFVCLCWPFFKVCLFARLLLCVAVVCLLLVMFLICLMCLLLLYCALC